MIFKEVKPSAVLVPFVRKYVLAYSAPHKDFPITSYPTRIEQALVFFARGRITSEDVSANTINPIARNAVFGQQTGLLKFCSMGDPEFLMVMAILQPGAIYRILGMPAQEVSGKFCDGESLLSAELQFVNDAISNAPSDEYRLNIVEKFLLTKTCKLKANSHPIDIIAQLLLYDPTRYSLDWLSNQANLSPRQFERKFNERIGIGPKLYARISRFYKALQYKERHPSIDWATIAFQFGYSDYCHLAKDFLQFANVTPSVKISRTENIEGAVLLDL